MDSKSQSAGNLVYEDLEPEFQWERDERTATLIVQLPGFRRDQLKVQITSTPLVKIIGERQISNNKRRRITKEFSIPSECDTNDVTAKFELGRLYIMFSIKEASKPQEADDSSKPREEDKAEAKPRNGVSEQKETVPEKKKKKDEEEGERDQENMKKKKVTTNGVVESIPSEPVSSKNGEIFGANQGLFRRTKTRVLDYTISLKPSLESEDFKQPKKWVNIVLLILFAVVLVIYLKQAFKSFLGVISKLQG